VQVTADLSRGIHIQVHNVAAASNAALQQDVKTLQEETEKLTAELEDSLAQFDVVQQEANQVEGEVVDEVCNRLCSAKSEAHKEVAFGAEAPACQSLQGCLLFCLLARSEAGHKSQGETRLNAVRFLEKYRSLPQCKGICNLLVFGGLNYSGASHR